MAFLDDIITKINTDDKEEKKIEPEKKDEEKKDEEEKKKEGLLEYSKEFYERFSS